MKPDDAPAEQGASPEQAAPEEAEPDETVDAVASGEPENTP